MADIRQYEVREVQDTRARAGQVLDAQDPRELTFYRGADAATQVWTLVIDTASNSEAYSVTCKGSTISYTSDGSATKAEIADGLAAAWNADAVARGLFVASSDGVDTITFTATAARRDITIAESANAAKMTLTESTSPADEDSIAPGLVVYRDTASSGAGGSRQATLDNPGTAKVLTWTVDTATNSFEYVVFVEVEGTLYEVAYTSDGSATAAEITAGLDAAADALSIPGVTVTSTATEFILTANVAGFNDWRCTFHSAELALAITEGSDPHDLVAGIVRDTYARQVDTIGGTSVSYPGRQPIPVVYDHHVAVEGGASAAYGDQVFIGQSGAEKGKLYNANDASETRLPLSKSVAKWVAPNEIKLYIRA